MDSLKNKNSYEISSLRSLDFLWLELTEKCNLNCIHCYADSSPRIPLNNNMVEDDWKKIMLEGYNAGCRKIQFIGGEPTISPYLPELIKYSFELGYEFIELFTNGIHFTDKIKEALIKYKVNLAFSLYSSNDKIHDAITKLDGSHNHTIQSIKWTINSGLTIRVAIVDVGLNTHTIDDTKALLKNIGVFNISVDKTRGIGRGNDSINTQSQIDELCGKCWKGKLCVTSSGEIYPCVFSRFWSVGNARDGLNKILESERLLEFRLQQKEKTQEHYLSINNCNPQCGPDCSPAECTPQSDCNPFCGPGQV